MGDLIIVQGAVNRAPITLVHMLNQFLMYEENANHAFSSF